MSRRSSLCAALLFASLVSPLAAQQPPQFRADVVQTGDEPFTGTFYMGASKIRIEGTSNGEEVVIIIDQGANNMLVLMPAERMYMQMDLGSAPFSAPSADFFDPANPCASGEVTDCENLGTENVNGRSTRKWAYTTMDGDRYTSWIATDLRFPVRTLEEDGTQSDFTNVQMGAQPASLFEPPAGYTAMAGIPGFGGPGLGAAQGRGAPVGRGRGAAVAGRGQAAGRGAVPPGRGQAAGRGAAPAAAGVDPAAVAQLTAQLQAMGLPPDQIAAAIAGLNASAATQGIDYSAWEAGDGWIADLVVTASSTGTETTPSVTSTSRFTARFTGSVPLTYGTPGVAGQGPGWALIPGVSSLTDAQRIVFSGTSEYRVEMVWPMDCTSDAFRTDGGRSVQISRATGSTDTADAAVTYATAQWQISGDLSTHTLMVGVGATQPTETTEVTTTITGRCPMSDAQNTTEQSTRQPQMGIQLNLEALPLSASPGVMQGTATTTMQFDLGGTITEVPANVEWTLRPIG
jgi:hypothetical protein